VTSFETTSESTKNGGIVLVKTEMISFETTSESAKNGGIVLIYNRGDIV